jgi:hypothetical protein
MGKVIKWLIIGLIIVGVLVGLMSVYGSRVTNPKVVAELTNDPQGSKASKVMLLTLPEGQVLPVNYLREANLVFVGADGGWWRQFQPSGAEVKVLIKGVQHKGQARVVLDNPGYTAEVFAKLRPTAPTWLPTWLNGKLVVIELMIPLPPLELNVEKGAD